MDEWTPEDFDQHAAWLVREREAEEAGLIEPDFEQMDALAEKMIFG